MDKKLTQQEFLKLQDWEKVKLKISDKRYADYIVMDEETYTRRGSVFLNLCIHFSGIDIDIFEDVRTAIYSQYLPFSLYEYFTPRLFETIPISYFHDFVGKCFRCKHFKGINDRDIKRNPKLVPVNGKCKFHLNSYSEFTFSGVYFRQNDEIPEDEKERLIRSRFRKPDYTCCYYSMRHIRRKRFEKALIKFCRKAGYALEDYYKDLDTLSIDLFFANSYKFGDRPKDYYENDYWGKPAEPIDIYSTDEEIL